MKMGRRLALRVLYLSTHPTHNHFHEFARLVAGVERRQLVWQGSNKTFDFGLINSGL